MNCFAFHIRDCPATAFDYLDRTKNGATFGERLEYKVRARCPNQEIAKSQKSQFTLAIQRLENIFAFHIAKYA